LTSPNFGTVAPKMFGEKDKIYYSLLSKNWLNNFEF
jgi:hypothetical protein